MNEDRLYPTPPTDKRDVNAQVRYLGELTNFIFGLTLSEAVLHGLRRYFARAGSENAEDLVGAILLECWEVHRAGTSLTELEIIRAADKLRQRLIRASRKTVRLGKPEITPSRDLPPEEEIPLVVREFQTILKRGSPEEALLFQRYYLDGPKDIRLLSEELHLSVATIYRRLEKIREKFKSVREGLEPSHSTD